MRAGKIVAIVLVGLGAGLMLFAAVQWLLWPNVAALATEPPSSTAFIDTYQRRQDDAGKDTTVAWKWVAWDSISVHAKRAVVAAEDMEFFTHNGFSSSEMAVALRDALAGERFRGASTITQQLAKNLWLSPSRNPWRKVKEALLTRSLERHLSKRRILDVYLNVVEFGPGVYGIEAAAQRYFAKPASGLRGHEAAMLAASLPRPSSWHPGVSSTSYARYVADIEGRMARATFLWRALGTPQALEFPLMPVPDSIPILGVDSLVIPDSIRDTVRSGPRSSRSTDRRPGPP
ncbi:MAG: monofunctional biosynthetic peptidoglycan transglycosylase [Gemmatimonadota bacterium]|nr:monofunctional biosynthetic peptidoglycan transglycosylase [Gemmatimonadota bacterium]MDH5198819.1 monofunctional biosynthetic peptidoglycan transglycosylase [Gemmatimonadota bacterium]